MLLLYNLRLLVWLLLHPSAWRAHLARIEPTLPPDACLVDLNWRQWRNPGVLKLILSGYLILPATVAFIAYVGLWLAGQPTRGVIAGLAFALGIGLIFGAILNIASGIAIAGILSPVFIVAWAGVDLLMVDFIVHPWFALIFGLSSAIVIHVTRNITTDLADSSLTRQVGGLVIGLFVSLFVIAIIVGILIGLVVGRQGGSVGGRVAGWLVGGMPAILLGLAVWWRTRSLTIALALALIVCATVMWLFGDTGLEFDRQPGGVRLLTSFSAVIVSIFVTLFAFPFILARSLVGSWLAAIAGAIGGLMAYPAIATIISAYSLRQNLIAAIVFLACGLTVRWWWSVLSYPFIAAWNTFLYRYDLARPDPANSRLRRHSVFWDELQRLPLYNLDKYLVLVVERNSPAGRQAIADVSASSQHWAARAAQIELDARRLESPATVAELSAMQTDTAAGLLGGSVGILLRNFNKLSEDIAAALSQPSAYNQRLVLRAVRNDLDSLLLELTRSSSRQAARYRSVANHWRNLVAGQIETLETTAETLQEIPNPYIVGAPLTKHQEIFVGRADVARHIEGLLRDQNHPPVLLYGQRRMGKTSLLYQLRWMLPHRILPLVIDLQGPVSLAGDHAGFLYNLARGIFRSAQRLGVDLGKLERAALTADPFTVFDEWIDTVFEAAVAQGRDTILLALDEFETLDDAMESGRLHEAAVLGTLRHIVQHRPGFKLLLAGSHTLEEFHRWSNYLINAQAVHLTYLQESEARQLIEHPAQDFPLAYAPDAYQRVLDLTRGHPYLVQLLCMEIVALKNQQDVGIRRFASAADVEAAAAEALTRGQQFFVDIERNQIGKDERALLRYLAHNKAQQQPDFHTLANYLGDTTRCRAALDKLNQRALIEVVADRYQFQAQLIRRWFSRCGAPPTGAVDSKAEIG